MVALFLDGFDKYGPVNNNNALLNTLLTQEWTAATTPLNTAVAAGLSATGYALLLSNGSGLAKTLAANYSRLVGGIRVASALTGQATLMQFRDGSTGQSSITLETSGLVNLRSGVATGTVLASGGTVAANSTHYLEWDITFGTAAAYQVWLDGVSLLSGTGNTRGGTTNNYANAIAIASSTNLTCDDLYLFDTTGTRNNAVLLSSPRIETTFPVSDSAVQFGFGAAVLGSPLARAPGNTAPTSNSLLLRRFVPAVACTLNSIGLLPGATSGTSNWRGVVYADSGGTAGTLMSSGSTVTGVTSGTAVTLPLVTPQSLAAGTQYWLGVMNDTSVGIQTFDGNNLSYRAAATFTSGAPSTAPAMTGAQTSYTFWGNLTGISGNNWYEASQQPAPGASSYVFDATVGQEDLYNFGSLSMIPANVYTVAVKGLCAKSDTGAKTLSLRMKSAVSDSAGTLAGQAPGTSYGWFTSMFQTDPNTGAAWTGTALNAAASGVRVDS